MSHKKVFIGNTELKQSTKGVKGEYVQLNGESFYKISNIDQMAPFFISLVSSTDHWMFLGSLGGISAGRRNEHSSLFPYYTDDKIIDFAEQTGSKTIIRYIEEDKIRMWEPFSRRNSGSYSITSNLYKNTSGNKIVFEEINEDLGLCFQYSWMFSDRYGIVKRSEILNTGENEASVEILDGLQNLLPFGITSDFQNRRSNLSNAYKKNELDVESGMGIYCLSSMIVDKAEPSEALHATTLWSSGLNGETLLSARQLDTWRHGLEVETEIDIRAERGAYFQTHSCKLAPNGAEDWSFVAELNQDHSNIAELAEKLTSGRDALIQDLEKDIDAGTERLRELVGMADGIQLTQDSLSSNRHFSNVLFNIMRGGIFDEQYEIETSDFLEYLEGMNKGVAATHSVTLSDLPPRVHYGDLVKQAKSSGDLDLVRGVYEYLPLIFSRRHGDPSRPWNQFSIDIKTQSGTKNRNYQGNWRDIFQNWEALGLSFPSYLPSMISKFLNASTVDGYNPYRITRSGIDWEVIEPDDPWSYIGYWGDHQIIYLLRLLELTQKHSPELLEEMLSATNFVYADVPYKIKPFDKLVENPKDTIDFDSERDQSLNSRFSELGGDGKLLLNAQGELQRANLLEKLLLTLLTKLSNFVPEAGIWLNTQRPEWNDANNALVGNGTSMVTVYYMRRYISFLYDLLSGTSKTSLEVNTALKGLLSDIHSILNDNSSLLDSNITNQTRREITENLGKAGEKYRESIYGKGCLDFATLDRDTILEFLESARDHIDHCIKANRREDGLYHSYNLIEFKGGELTVEYLYEMLEGQVSALTSGLLSAREASEVLDALKSSKIFRPDQYSYLLYPDRDLPRFQNKNVLPADFVSGSSLAEQLIASEDTSILSKDVGGDCHFNGNFHNANDLEDALDRLAENDKLRTLVLEEKESFLEAYEAIFDHKSFTGRSGTFFGYEGLGSIYWHMVSKLLLATQENIVMENRTSENAKAIDNLVEHYYEIRAGIGINKSPELYGAFPTDPYSHTPAHRGAQQPGMTGQVKEDIISRWAELGVQVENGEILFRPTFLNPTEFLAEPQTYTYYSVRGEKKEIELQKDQLAFTYCQVPIIYQMSGSSSMDIIHSDGNITSAPGNHLSKEISRELFDRSCSIQRIQVNLHFL